MASLPVCSGRDAIRAFGHLGWSVARKKGSHVVMVKSGSQVTLSIPDHRVLAPGTLRSLIRVAGTTVDAFVEAMGR